MKKVAQIDRVLEYMKTHDTITSIEAFEHLGCTRLAAQIFALKEKGYDIKSEMREVGNGKRVAFYSLIK